MILKDILQNIKIEKSIGDLSVEISGIQFDSRKVESGNLFVATRGTASDGHTFIPMAIEKEAVAILCEEIPTETVEDIAYIKVKDSSDALGLSASAWYNFPSEKLTLVGVTGTNGKTTTATLLYELFRELGHKAGLLSTVKNYVNDEVIEATHTTPDALALNELLVKMVDAGCR